MLDAIPAPTIPHSGMRTRLSAMLATTLTSDARQRMMSREWRKLVSTLPTPSQCDGVGRVLTSFLHSRDIILWRASLVSVVANIALNLVLIPLWGIVGAGIASSICYGGLTIAALRAFGAETGVRSSAVLLPTTEDVRVVGRALGELPGRLLGRG